MLSPLLKRLKILKAKGLRYGLKRTMSKLMPNFLLSHPELVMLPTEIMIEPTAACNLRCPLCSNPVLKRTKGIMTQEMFEAVLTNLDAPIKEITIGLTGEPLINPHVFTFIKKLSSRGIKCSLPTNGILFDRFSMNEIFDSGLHHTNIAIDGATEQTYLKYRIGGDFTRLVKNIKALCDEKRRRNAKYPIITMQFLVMKTNEHEIDAIKKLATELQPDRLHLKSAALWTSLTHRERGNLAKEWLPTHDEFSRYNGDLLITEPVDVCPFAYDNSVILWNGDVALCCYDFDGKYIFGNLIKEKFSDVYHKEKYYRIRKEVIDQTLDICKECDITSATKTGKYLYFNKALEKEMAI